MKSYQVPESECQGEREIERERGRREGESMSY